MVYLLCDNWLRCSCNYTYFILYLLLYRYMYRQDTRYSNEHQRKAMAIMTNYVETIIWFIAFLAAVYMPQVVSKWLLIIVVLYFFIINVAIYFGKFKDMLPITDANKWPRDTIVNIKTNNVVPLLAKHNYFDMAKFVDFGYLQEVNRKFFHPLGVAMHIEFDNNRKPARWGIIDCRRNKVGLVYHEKFLEHKNAKAATIRIEKERIKRLGYRMKEFGGKSEVQPIPKGTKS